METYELNTGFKVFFWIFGVLTLGLFLVGLVIIILAVKARATVYDDRLEYWWLGLKTIPWEDMTGFQSARSTGGLLGSMMNPHTIIRANGKRMNFPAGTFKRSQELIASIRAHSGLEANA